MGASPKSAIRLFHLQNLRQMQLESQVITLPQSTRLKELGVIQGSTWYHVAINTKDGLKWFLSNKVSNVYIVFGRVNGQDVPHYDESVIKECYSAFTVAELGVMLPNITKCADVLQEYLENVFGGDASDSDNEELFWRSLFNADFLAGCLIYLLTFNHITADEVNKRLSE